MRKSGLRYLLIFIATAGSTYCTAITTKMSIGTYACWDALSLNVSQLTGMKVAYFSIILNLCCVAFQFLMLGKEFQARRLLQVPYAVLFGVLVNGFYYSSLMPEAVGYGMRLVICIASVVGNAFCLGLVTYLDTVSLPVETTCKIASGKFAIDYAVLRVGIDVVCIVASVVLSLIFHLSFAIREGTFLALALLGPLEKQSMRFWMYLAKKKQESGTGRGK